MYVSKIQCDGESEKFCKIFWNSGPVWNTVFLEELWRNGVPEERETVDAFGT
jgi:hypothetical protein